jgi:nucleoside 2-deoxyribosyltransferase
MAGGPCSALGRPRVYIASPIFTPVQLDAVGEVVAVLEDAGYITYSPSRDGVMLAPTDPPGKRDEVFFSNVVAIKQSDLLVAILDVKDTGTIWELGMATGRGMPIVAVTLALETMNVMLERGIVAHVLNLHDLDDVVRNLLPFLTYGAKQTEEHRELHADVLTTLKANFSYSGQTQ